MPNLAIHKAGQLSPEARAAVENLLGRRLLPEEEVSVMALGPHPAPVENARKAAVRRLKQRIDKTAAKTSSIPDSELDELIDEASSWVRAHPE